MKKHNRVIDERTEDIILQVYRYNRNWNPLHHLQCDRNDQNRNLTVSRFIN